MDETPKPESQPVAWYPAGQSCPRCNTPVRAKGSRNMTRMIKILCLKCGWNLEIEEIRKSIQSTMAIPEDEEEDDNE